MGPVGAIHLLGPVGVSHLLGPVGPIHLSKFLTKSSCVVMCNQKVNSSDQVTFFVIMVFPGEHEFSPEAAQPVAQCLF